MAGMKTRIIGAGGGSSAFDGNRSIKSIPGIGANLGGETVAEFLENAFFAFVKATISINSSIAYYEKGIAQNVAISGNVTANDETSFSNARIERTVGNNIIFAAQSGAYSVTASNTSADTDYIAKIDTVGGGTIASATKQVKFIFPFLTGMNAEVLLANDFYTGLTKSIAPKANKSITLNGSNQYIYFCYPASYGNLTSIKDQNGFTVTDAFNQYTATLFVGGGLVESYKIYRTTDPTTVVNAIFQFNF
jgi:hypothetical protein